MGFLDWLSKNVNGIDDVRDVLYIVVGIPALVLLWWRSASANKQARAALEQVKVAQDQYRLARADSLTDLFQAASDMLGSQVIAVRIGGVHALTRLAEHRPEEFHIRVMELFCAFLNTPPPHPSDPPPYERDDIHKVLQILKRRSDPAVQLEKEQKFSIYLRSAQLSGTALRSSRFARAHLVQTNISHAYAEWSDFSLSQLEHCDLSHGRFASSNFFLANIFRSNLSSSNFRAANFHRVNMHLLDLSASNFQYATLTQASLSALDLTEANLQLADLSGARIRAGRRLKPDGEIDEEEVYCLLTQAQLDEAAANPSKPPEIQTGTLDAVTGRELVWNDERGRQNWERLQALRKPQRLPTSDQ